MIQANKLFLVRQSILGRTQNLEGLELLFRHSKGSAARFPDDDSVTSLVINHAFNELGFETVLGKYRGFVHVSRNILMSDMIELLPKDRMVFELLSSVQIDADVVERCKKLKSLGYMLALDDLLHHPGDIEMLHGIVDILKVDIQQASSGQLPGILGHYKKWPVKLLAENVDTRDAAKYCFDLGFNLFQGHYFSRPTIISGRRLTHSELEVIRLIGLVMGDASTEKIEQVFKENPGLSFSLLRLANAVSVGAYRKITSINHAITEVGRRQLLRWLQMLLFTVDHQATFPNPLLQLAATRGRFMERLAQLVDHGNHELEDFAYMVGIMSLMDTLLCMPLAEIIAPLNLTLDISSALLFRSGQLGSLLQLIEYLERDEPDAAGQLLEQLGLDIDEVNAAQIEALSWSNRIGMEH